MKEVPVLHTARCILTAVTQVDIPMLREILDDADTQRFLPELCEEFRTAESLLQFITSFDNYLAHNEGILWGIRLLQAPNLIGFISIMDIPGNPTLFYAMHFNYRNRGYMKDSLSRVLQFADDKKFCKEIQTEVYCANFISEVLLSDIHFMQYRKSEKKVFYKITID
jgi:RimJ/RimL family protein N-acetyltransferase